MKKLSKFYKLLIDILFPGGTGVAQKINFNDKAILTFPIVFKIFIVWISSNHLFFIMRKRNTVGND